MGRNTGSGQWVAGAAQCRRLAVHRSSAIPAAQALAIPLHKRCVACCVWFCVIWYFGCACRRLHKVLQVGQLKAADCICLEIESLLFGMPSRSVASPNDSRVVKFPAVPLERPLPSFCPVSGELQPSDMRFQLNTEDPLVYKQSSTPFTVNCHPTVS